MAPTRYNRKAPFFSCSSVNKSAGKDPPDPDESLQLLFVVAFNSLCRPMNLLITLSPFPFSDGRDTSFLPTSFDKCPEENPIEKQSATIAHAHVVHILVTNFISLKTCTS